MKIKRSFKKQVQYLKKGNNNKSPIVKNLPVNEK